MGLWGTQWPSILQGKQEANAALRSCPLSSHSCLVLELSIYNLPVDYLQQMLNLALDFPRSGKFLETLKLKGEKVICLGKQDWEHMRI